MELDILFPTLPKPSTTKPLDITYKTGGEKTDHISEGPWDPMNITVVSFLSFPFALYISSGC